MLNFHSSETIYYIILYYLVIDYDNDQFRIFVDTQPKKHLVYLSYSLKILKNKARAMSLIKEGDLVLIHQRKEKVWQLRFLSDLDL